MSLLSLIIILVVLGVGLYLLRTYVPMDAKIMQIITIVVIIVALLLVVNAFGLLDAIRGVQVPRVGR
jgi:hypothetical protein